MAKKKRKKSAFVPRLIVPAAAAAVGVVPAVAVGIPACSSDTQSTSAAFSVAAVAYPAYEAGTDDAGDDVTDAAPDFFGVAAVAYPAYEAGSG